MADLPIVVNASGYVPQTPNALLTLLTTNVSAVNPGFTNNLPGILIEDLSSTSTYVMVQLDSSVAELVNSITPYGANAFLLNQLGTDVYGVPPQSESLTSVYLQFTGPPGWVISQGFVVSDGTYQYRVPDGGVVGTGGTSALLYSQATVSGAWAVPAGSVTQFVTSVDSSVIPAPTVTNPAAGLPASIAQTEEQYRGRVLDAGIASAQGMGRFLKTKVRNVSGVQYRLVTVKQIQTGGLWEVLCGGGDQYQVAYAIWQGLFDINALTGSVLLVDNITQANPGVVTTTLNHLFSTGQNIGFTGIVGMTTLNAVVNPQVQAVILSPTTFSMQTTDAISSMSLGGGTVTVTASHALLGLTISDTYTVVISGVTPSSYNGTFTATITGVSTFTYPLSGSPGSVTTQGTYVAPLDTRAFSAYASGGVITPNFRNVTVNLLNYPDTYTIPFVNPPIQNVTMTVTWNTIATNYVNPSAIAQLAVPALVDYINNISVGQPINTLVMTTVFQTAIASLIPSQLLTRLVFAVSLNGIGVSPISGTGEIPGDPESYFYATSSSVVVVQG